MSALDMTKAGSASRVILFDRCSFEGLLGVVQCCLRSCGSYLEQSLWTRSLLFVRQLWSCCRLVQVRWTWMLDWIFSLYWELLKPFEVLVMWRLHMWKPSPLMWKSNGFGSWTASWEVFSKNKIVPCCSVTILSRNKEQIALRCNM